MQPFPPDLWIAIQCSLAYVEESRRLIEQATRIREESKVLRRDSAALIRSKFMTPGENCLLQISKLELDK